MSAFDFDPTTLAAFVAMGVATYATRLAGLTLVRHIPSIDRFKAALEAVPPAVLMTVIAPMALATGWAETLAAAITAIAATRLPLFVVVAIGVLSVVGLRMVLS
ncbi:AzlD domain-containing protein [Breoghania sp.]|uniref:AzlD family protein n=1 Tax=Breoghania sp. TaxID=2065378 RepID=UPI002611C3EB|nr:AzlD domain-containing protein [Breoghania sp.]MDJ0931172.1 AzlD domain-containing protein [Breoghania sp.]